LHAARIATELYPRPQPNNIFQHEAGRVGRPRSLTQPAEQAATVEAAVERSGTVIDRRARVTDLDLSLGAGEILGLAGLEGSGVSAALQMLGGVVPVRGRLEVKGRAVFFKHPSQVIAMGVVCMPADRKNGGLWLDRDTSFNISAATVARMAALRWPRWGSLDAAVATRMIQVGVRANALHELAGRLSGGNQQRIWLGRMLESRPCVVLQNDFTRGVGVQAKAAIHGLVRTLADSGMAICITSSDFEELLDVADRIICMRARRIVANRPSGDFDKVSLLTMVAAPINTVAT
ncbi:MAG TPA: ATP-binding cassette domain-containing protein, partial [Acidisoma sp.]|nr:ATP-binding cassette domain-containing protein [Acidisoma sp.]